MHKIQKRIIRLAKEEDISSLGYRKLGEKIKVDHPQQVKWHLNKLISDGYLQPTPDGGLVVASAQPNLAKIPILGAANCGQPLIMADNRVEDYLTVSKGMLPARGQTKLFAVRASGDSMNRANINGLSINDSDYVLIDSSRTSPTSGDYVLASIEGLATIKRFVRDEDQQIVALISESSNPRPPIVVSSDEINSFIIHGQANKVVATPKI